MLLRAMKNVKCRNGLYPNSQVRRFPIENEFVGWLINYDGYEPTHYESPSLQNKPWSDPALGAPTFHPQWNRLDGKIDRRSHTGDYHIVNGAPQNPIGRTGIVGRGLLGRWGPNHAADPIVTRWKRKNGSMITHHISKLPILQFCAIQRHDNGEWAIPGGMVDPGEHVSQTLLREFMEEALNSLQKNQEEMERDKKMLETFFRNGEEIYKGYVDDPRNTDNAWMETVAVNFHDDTGDLVGKFALAAGDDAKGVRWMDIDHELLLYASHLNFISNVTALRKAHY